MRILVFGTVYCDTDERLSLARRWSTLHRRLNPACDLLLVDSNSPMMIDGAPVLQLGDNIGHLSRNGRDGWGRAFCVGLQYAIDNGYDYVIHVEGDSLLRCPVTPFCEYMQQMSLPALACLVSGTRSREFDWVETGVMFFSVKYLNDSRFVDRYDWPDGASKKYPRTPEAVIHEMLDQDGALNIAPIEVTRDDKHVLTRENVRKYDWITHTSPDVYDAFIASSMVPT